MTIEQPKISVCIPTYNQGRYLGQALESVLRQTLSDFEIIVYDDASTDDTQQVVEGVRDARLRYFRQSHNVGIAGNRNSCLAVARGQYITWLDSDDVYLPEMLTVQSAVLDQHPNVGLAHSAYEVIDGEGRLLPDWPLPFACDVREPGREALRELVLSNYVTVPTVMVRRACYDRVGSYATQLANSGEDWEMWLRISLHADLFYTATPLAQYRQHEASISTATVKSGERLRYDIKVIKRLFTQQRALIPDASLLERRARAALAAKALMCSGDAFTSGHRAIAFTAALRGIYVARSLLRGRHSWLLLLSIMRDDEYDNYRHSKAMLDQLYAHLAGTRYGDRIKKQAVVNPEWERTLRDIARTVRQFVPSNSRIASVDKWDPTLLYLSQRKGWHFPDRRLLPGGYPRDSSTAIEHLEQLKRRGAGYIVFPSAAFWWLDHYEDFRRHLNTNYRQLWRNEDCILYQLSQPDNRDVERVARINRDSQMIGETLEAEDNG